MADQDRPIEEQINEAREAVFAALRNPNSTWVERKNLQENLSRLLSRQIVARQMANEPKPYLLPEMRK